MMNVIGYPVGHGGNELSRSKYTIAHLLFPEKTPEKNDVKTFTQAKILKSIHFPGFENLNCDVSLSSSQETKLSEASRDRNPHEAADMMKNRMLLEMAFRKTEEKSEYDYNEAKPLF